MYYRNLNLVPDFSSKKRIQTSGPELAWVKPHIKSFQELDIEYLNADTVFRSTAMQGLGIFCR